MAHKIKTHKQNKKHFNKKLLWIQVGFFSLLSIIIVFLFMPKIKGRVLGDSTSCQYRSNVDTCHGTSICVVDYNYEPNTITCGDGIYQRFGSVVCYAQWRFGRCYDLIGQVPPPPTATPIPPPPTATPRPWPTATPVPQQSNSPATYYWNECQGCSCVNVGHSYSAGNQCYPAGTNVNNSCGCSDYSAPPPTATPVPSCPAVGTVGFIPNPGFVTDNETATLYVDGAQRVDYTIYAPDGSAFAIQNGNDCSGNTCSASFTPNASGTWHVQFNAWNNWCTNNKVDGYLHVNSNSSSGNPSPTLIPTEGIEATDTPTPTFEPGVPTPTPTILVQPTVDTSNQPPTNDQNNSTSNPFSNFFNAVGNVVNNVINSQPQQTQPTESIQPTLTQIPRSEYYNFHKPPTPTPIITVKVKRPDGTQIELSPDALAKMSDILQSENLPQIKRLYGTTYAIIKNGVQASTTFPLSINLADNSISVTTEGGERTITIAPDEAVQIAKGRQIISTVTDQNGSQMQLASYNGDPVYIIKGGITKQVSFFIYLKVNLPLSKIVYISAETGNVVKTDQTIVSQVLDSIPTIK